MLADQYLLPLAELAASVGLPLVLTLKALQVAATPSTRPQTALRILAFWLTYWLVLSLAQLAGVNSHVRCIIATVYYSRSDGVQTYLLSVYQSTLLPFTATMLFRVARVHLSTEELDNAVSYVLYRMCFDPNYFADNLLEMTAPKATSPAPSKASFWPLTTRSESKTASSGDCGNLPTAQLEPVVGLLENIIPLEMTRARSPQPAPPPYPTQTIALQPTPQEKSRSRRRSKSLQGSKLPKKPSRQDLRSLSTNTVEERAPPDTDQLLNITAVGTPVPRVPSGADLVFEESPPNNRNSIRGSLKGIFS